MSTTDNRLSRRQLVKLGVGTAAATALAGRVALPGPVAAAAAALQAADVPREKTLILVGVGGEAPNQFTDVELMNLYLPGISRSGFQIAFEPTAIYNFLGGTEEMWLAESHQSNADFTEVTIKLRPGILWNDGQPFTAADIAFTMAMLRDNAPTLGFSVDMEKWVTDATAVDDLTVHVTLNTPNPRFFDQFFLHYNDNGFYAMPRHIWEGQDPTTFTNYDLAKGWPIATGPYKLVLSSPEQKIWDLRPDWWAAASGFQPLPKVERVIYLPGYEESRMAEMMIANEADATLALLPINILPILEQNPKVTTHSGNESPYGYIDWWPTAMGFNCLTPPFDDAEIRWALSYALDREQIIEFGTRAAGMVSHAPFPFYPALVAYLEGIEDLFEQYPTNLHDPTKSDEILTRKGYAKDGDGFYAKDGQRLTVPITIAPNLFGDITPVIVEQFRRAGIDSSFQAPTDFWDRMTTGEADAFLFGQAGSVRDPYLNLNLFHGLYVKPTGETTYPFWRWANAEYDVVVDQMGNTAPDDPQMPTLFRQAMEIWLRELPALQIMQWFHRIPMNQTYWVGWPTAEDPYINGSFWSHTFLKVLTRLQPAAG